MKLFRGLTSLGLMTAVAGGAIAVASGEALERDTQISQ